MPRREISTVSTRYKKFQRNFYCRNSSTGMPITKSAKKALRQNKRRKARNLVYKKKIKILIKEVRSLVSAKKIEEAKKLLPKVYKILDKAAKVNVIKKNTAARRKSRITKLISKKF